MMLVVLLLLLIAVPSQAVTRYVATTGSNANTCNDSININFP